MLEISRRNACSQYYILHICIDNYNLNCCLSLVIDNSFSYKSINEILLDFKKYDTVFDLRG